MSEKLHILEVGMGHSPAVINGGTLFDRSSTTYTGIDLMKNTNFRGDPLHRDERRYMLSWIDDTKRKLEERKSQDKEIPATHFVQASVDVLPFRNAQFDYVLLRSVFGQFTIGSSGWVSHLEAVSGRGLKECHRVLKPGGEIVILEENTPWKFESVEAYLQDAGFSVTDQASMDEPFRAEGENVHWKQLREPFFKDLPRHGPHFAYGSPYIMIGTKPQE